MSTEHHTSTHDDQPVSREREVIVTNGSGANTSIASAVVAIFSILAVLLVGWFVVQSISGNDGVDIPTEFDVNVDDNTGDTSGQ